MKNIYKLDNETLIKFAESVLHAYDDGPINNLLKINWLLLPVDNIRNPSFLQLLDDCLKVIFRFMHDN